MDTISLDSGTDVIHIENKLTREDTLKFFNYDDMATDVYLKKYALTDRNGHIEEWLPSQMWRRLARAAASVENNPMWEDKFFDILNDWKAVPQGSIMFSLGNKYQVSSASNCFVVPIKSDSLEGIFEAAKQMALTYAYRGGVGIDISTLRPEGAQVSNAARTSTGAWSFMDFFSYVTRLIGQHGRRGALMLTISDRHPDLMRFITAKQDKSKVTGANVSIRISDAFMTAVKNNDTWRMSFDTKHESIVLEEPAQKIWNMIIECATNSAEPGVLFWDTILKESPSDCYTDVGFATQSTNPCITADTWVTTSNGAQQVSDLIGNQFIAIVNGKPHKSTEEGFYYTGYKSVIKITTKRGYSLRCTPDHLIKTKTGDNYEWVKAADLTHKHNIVLANHRCWDHNTGNAIDSDLGWLIGNVIGDGVFTEKEACLQYWGKNKFHMKNIASEKAHKSLICRSDLGSGRSNSVNAIKYDRVRIKSRSLRNILDGYNITKDKSISSDVERRSTVRFCAGLLQGWFDADGTVHKNREKQSFAVRLSSINLESLKIAQRILSKLGIASTIYTNRRVAGYYLLPDGHNKMKEYYCKTIHELHVSKDNLPEFAKRVNFADPDKKQKLSQVLLSYNRGPYKETFTDIIQSVEDDGHADVYDCTIPDVNEFDANGICVHNCSEIPLPPHDACTLLSMNLTKYTRCDFTNKAEFDFSAFKEDVAVTVRFLDNVKELDLKLMPLKEQREIAAKGRRIGMGTHGLADALANLCIKYDSNESLEFIDKIYKFYAKAVYQASVDLAEEKGAFPIFDEDKEKDNPFLKRIGFAGVPRRNIACLTCAPTGSLSCLCQTSSGVEPVFRNIYRRRRKITHDESLNIPDSNLYKDVMGDLWQEYDVAHHNVMRYLKHKNFDFSHGLEDAKLPAYFVESDKIDWNRRVQIQATMQKWIDHAISSTCNLPAGTSVDVVRKVYEEAYRAGCKGFTVYVDGCRDGVLISQAQVKVKKTNAPKRPKTLPARVHHIKSKGEDYFVMVGLMNDEPYEVFAGKNGFVDKVVKSAEITKIKRGHYCATLDSGVEIPEINEYITDEEAAITRLLSLSIRHGADMEYVVTQLEKVPGDMHNFAKTVARALKKHIPDGVKASGIACKACSSENVVREEGCARCIDCGWSGCN